MDVTNYLSILSILIGIIGLSKSWKAEQQVRAWGIVGQIDRKNRITEQEECLCRERNICLTPVLLKNNSNSEYRKIFIIVVNNWREKHIGYGGKLLDNVRISIEGGYFSYIPSLIDEEELLIPSGGNGMHAQPGIILAYEDVKVKRWIKDSNGRIYKTKKYEERLLKLGLPLPGYETCAIYKRK